MRNVELTLPDTMMPRVWVVAPRYIDLNQGPFDDWHVDAGQRAGSSYRRRCPQTSIVRVLLSLALALGSARAECKAAPVALAIRQPSSEHRTNLAAPEPSTHSARIIVRVNIRLQWQTRQDFQG